MFYRLFVLSWKNSDTDPTKISKKYYVPFLEIKDFNALYHSRIFFDQPEKKKKENKKQMKNLCKCQEMITNQVTY